jgi:hypothetical protein
MGTRYSPRTAEGGRGLGCVTAGLPSHDCILLVKPRNRRYRLRHRGRRSPQGFHREFTVSSERLSSSTMPHYLDRVSSTSRGSLRDLSSLLLPHMGPPHPRAACILSLTHLLACHTFVPLAVYPADSGKARPIAWRGGGQLGHERICFPVSGWRGGFF